MSTSRHSKLGVIGQGLMGLVLLAGAGNVRADRLAANLVPNGDFQQSRIGELPDGWTLHSAAASLTPVFKMVKRDGERLLMATGDGNPDCVGYISTNAPVTLGKTYRLKVLLRMSEDLNPHEHLLFQCFRNNTRNGISQFRRLEDGWVQGDVKIHYPGQGKAEAEVRILFRLSSHGKVWVKNISLVETDPVRPRWVTVACTQGTATLETCRAVLDASGKAGVDLVLLTEYMQGGLLPEPVPGPSSKLMSEKAREYRMYVAGGIVRKDVQNERLYNTALLYDRQGELAGSYDKLHPYSPELNEQGITPGSRVPVFSTDFGKVGFMICYDSWFTDVARLLSLRGAEIILFPNAGYYRSLMPARSADNCVRIVSSSWNSGYGVWDTVGREVLSPQADPTHKPVVGTTFKNPIQTEVGPVKVLTVTLDLNCSPSPAYNGGTMRSAPGGRRNRHEQKVYLEDLIKQERSRWWVE